MGEERTGELVDKSKENFQPRDEEIDDLKKKKTQLRAVEIRMKFWYTSNYHS